MGWDGAIKNRSVGHWSATMQPSSTGNGTSGQALKKAARLGAHIVFADESGFLLIPNVAKTWAPIGETPIPRHPCRRDKVAVISGLSVRPIQQRLNLLFICGSISADSSPDGRFPACPSLTKN